MLLSEPIHPTQIAAYRRMTGEQKYQLAMSFYFTAHRIKTAALVQKHPDWSREELKQAVKRHLHHANL